VATPSGNKANEFQDCLRLSTRKESTTEAWRERGVRTQKRVFANLFKNALNPCHSLVCFASGFFEQTVFAKKTEGFLSLIVPKKPHRPAHPSSRGTIADTNQTRLGLNADTHAKKGGELARLLGHGHNGGTIADTDNPARLAVQADDISRTETEWIRGFHLEL
jgi:hypothetical protein